MTDEIDDAGAVNLSTGIGTSFLKFAEIAGRAASVVKSIALMPAKPEGVYARIGDTAKQRSFGFSPKITLEQGIERILSHMSVPVG